MSEPVNDSVNNEAAASSAQLAPGSASMSPPYSPPDFGGSDEELFTAEHDADAWSDDGAEVNDDDDAEVDGAEVNDRKEEDTKENRCERKIALSEGEYECGKIMSKVCKACGTMLCKECKCKCKDKRLIQAGVIEQSNDERGELASPSDEASEGQTQGGEFEVRIEIDDVQFQSNRCENCQKEIGATMWGLVRAQRLACWTCGEIICIGCETDGRCAKCFRQEEEKGHLRRQHLLPLDS
jgi:hypothetical protein